MFGVKKLCIIYQTMTDLIALKSQLVPVNIPLILCGTVIGVCLALGIMLHLFVYHQKETDQLDDVQERIRVTELWMGTNGITGLLTTCIIIITLLFVTYYLYTYGVNYYTLLSTKLDTMQTQLGEMLLQAQNVNQNTTNLTGVMSNVATGYLKSLSKSIKT